VGNPKTSAAQADTNSFNRLSIDRAFDAKCGRAIQRFYEGRMLRAIRQRFVECRRGKR
jgi:hypothetical protein